MNIALVQPPNPQRIGDWKRMKVSRPPLNIALLASYVRQFGHTPTIYDFDWCEDSVDWMAQSILSSNPDVVGFTCLTPRLHVTLYIAVRIKELCPRVKTVVGGAHVNGVKGKSHHWWGMDYAIYGEGEQPLLELLDTLETGGDTSTIENLIYPRNGRVTVNPQRPFVKLDELPFPAWDLLNLQEYKDPATFDGIHMGVMTTRGCPWNCTFCASGAIYGRTVRYRSVENVLEELEQIVGLGIRNIMFYDDTFTLNKARFLRIAEGMVSHKLNLKYYCQLRADTVDCEIAMALARSGCIGAALGVESGDEEILKTLCKGITKGQVRSAVGALKSAGVPTVASYILGSPGETHESVRKTLDFAGELNTDQAKFMICTPFPGTPLFDMAVERGLLSYDMTPAQFTEATYYYHVAANLSEVSDEDLIHYQEEGYKTKRVKEVLSRR